MGENTTLATEIFRELKASCKRWFIAFLVMVALEIITVIGFIYYISIPVEEYSIEQNSTDRSLNMVNGGDINECIPEIDIQEGSSSEP